MENFRQINYFNPRSREGSDRNRILHSRGHTDFNPRSREGSDTPKESVYCHPENFNPRSREGSDAILGGPANRKKPISIHAPAKGATKHGNLSVSDFGFQSTLPRRERLIGGHFTTGGLIFQSTLPRRERPGEKNLYGGMDGISIHAPAKGATAGVGGAIVKISFQSTLPRRERLILFR